MASRNSRRSERRQRTALVALRLLPEEHHRLLQAARTRGVSLSEFLRSSALASVAADPTDLPSSRAG